MRLNHLQLQVRDLEQASAFWCTHFDMVRGRTCDGVRFLHDDAGFDLALHACATPAPLPPGFHLGFRLDSVLAVEQRHDRLLRAGVPLAEPLTEEADMVWFRCIDPDGHLIEIYWEQAATGEAGA